MVSTIGKEEAESLLGLVGSYSVVDLRKAYKKCAKRFHPDIAVMRGMPRSSAEEKMKLVNQANDYITALFNSWPYPEFLQSDYFGDEPSFDFDRIFDDEVFNGAYVTFGRYPSTLDGGELPISWYVIEANSDSALLICEQCIDVLQFDESCANAIWNESAIRYWLNNTFLSQVFSPFERKSVMREPIRNDVYSPYGIHGGPDTIDQVFFLSADEARELFINDDDRACSPSDYSLHRGIWSSGNDCSRWWLRSPGRDIGLVAFVDECGVVHESDGLRPVVSDVGIRPAIRVKLERRTRDYWDLEQRRQQRQAAAESEKMRKREAEEQSAREEELRRQARKEAIDREDERARRIVGSVYANQVFAGASIMFGCYGLDGSSSPSALCWRVLRIENGKALLITEQCIEARPFHPNNVPANWDNCALKSWMNEDFLYSAFSPEERAVLSPTDDGSFVRLLTCSEATSFMPEKSSRVSTASPSMLKTKPGCCDDVGCDWWLMDSGIDESFAAYVYRNGKVLDFGLTIGNLAGVRPVITINVK